MKNIGYSEFVLLCNVCDPEDWSGWLSVRPDGVYIKPLPVGFDATPLERSTWTEHPLYDLTKPVLAFPCNWEELRAFDESQRLGLELDGAYEDAHQAVLTGDLRTPSGGPAVEGVTTAQIVEAFGSLVEIRLAKAMTDGAVWTRDARRSTGTRGGKHLSRWDPVIMATALSEKHKVPLPRLNQAFHTYKFLAAWREEWTRFSTM